MTTVTLRQLCKAVDDYLAAGITAARQVQSGARLTESIPEFPLIQVYFDGLEASKGSDTDRISFGVRGQKPTRNTSVTLIIDVYAAQRANIGQDMVAIETMTDAVLEVLEQQTVKPFFGLAEIDAFSYSAERVTFTYAKVEYVGVRFTLPLTII